MRFVGFAQDRDELFLGKIAEELGSGRPAAPIEAHVEGTVGAEGEAAFGVRELKAREPEIGDEAADRPLPAFFSMTRASSL